METQTEVSTSARGLKIIYLSFHPPCLIAHLFHPMFRNTSKYNSQNKTHSLFTRSTNKESWVPIMYQALETSQNMKLWRRHTSCLPESFFENFLFVYLFLWLHGEACRILIPWPGIKPTPPALEDRVSTTGPQRNFPFHNFKICDEERKAQGKNNNPSWCIFVRLDFIP